MKFDWKRYLARWRRYGIAGAVGGAVALGAGSSYGVTVVPGQLINVDFNGASSFGFPSNPGTFNGDLTQSEATAASVNWVDETPGDDTWNGINDPRWVEPGDGSGSFEDLSDSTGAATGVNLSWGAFTRSYANYNNSRWGNPTTWGPNADGWMIQFNEGDLVFSFTGLVENGVYGVTAIGVEDPITVTVGGTTLTSGAWPGDLSNYVEFTGATADDTGELIVTLEDIVPWVDKIGGFQILASSPTLISVQTGAWDNPDTWNDGALTPTADLRVFVVQDHQVDVTANGAASELGIQDTGLLVVGAGNTLDVTTVVDVASGAGLTVEGTLLAETLESAGSTTLAGGSTLTVDTVNVTDGTFDFTASGDLTVPTMSVIGGTVNTGANHVVLSNKLTLSTTTFTISPTDTFAAQGPDLLAEATLTLGGGTLTVGPETAELTEPDRHLLVTANSIMHFETPGEATVGNLTVEAGMALQVEHAESLSVNDLSVHDEATLDAGSTFIRGTIRPGGPGGSVGSATIIGPVEMGEEAGYVAELEGAGNDLLAIQSGDIDLAGTLEVQAIGKLDAFGVQTRRIMQIGGEDAINGTFAFVPDMGTFDPVPDPDEWTPGSYLGSGVWFGDDRTGQGIVYVDRVLPDDPASAVQIAVFQAKEGDTDGDRDVDFADFNDLANNYTGSLDPGTGGKDWLQGDFDLDGDVDFADFNELANNYTGTNNYYVAKGGVVPEPGTLTLLVCGGLGLVLLGIRRPRRTEGE